MGRNKTAAIINSTVDSDPRFTIVNNTSRRGALANIVFGTNTICTDPEDIIIIVDGDDRLIDGDVLTHLNDVYSDPTTWATYGQYVFKSDNSQGHCEEGIGVFNRYNYGKWNISHLRTYKNFLFKNAVVKPQCGILLRCGCRPSHRSSHSPPNLHAPPTQERCWSRTSGCCRWQHN